MPPIEVEELTKNFGDVLAIDSLSFTVEEGEIFGYLGPNGAGKTTTIRTLLGLLSPTAGTASVLGANIHHEDALVEAKRRIGFLPADLSFNDQVTGQRVLDYHASVKGDERRRALLEIFDPPLDRPIREYSSGNKQMLGLIQAFMHDPDLVIMDEPTAGLDPLKQEEFNEFIGDEQDRGTTIFFSSHVLSEVRRVCDRVGILRDGRLVALEDIDSLLQKGGKRVHVLSSDDISTAVTDMEGVFDVTKAGEEIQFTYAGKYNTLLRRLTDYDVLDIDISEPPLEDIFMHYYGTEDEGTAVNMDVSDREEADV